MKQQSLHPRLGSLVVAAVVSVACRVVYAQVPAVLTAVPVGTGAPVAFTLTAAPIPATITAAPIPAVVATGAPVAVATGAPVAAAATGAPVAAAVVTTTAPVGAGTVALPAATTTPTVATVALPSATTGGGNITSILANQDTNPTANGTTTSVANNGTLSQSTATWGGCVKSTSKMDTTVRLAAATRICLQVANAYNWAAGVTYVRAAFEPVADTYARLHIPNSYSDLIGTGASGGVNATAPPASATDSSASPFMGRNITLNAASQYKNSLVRTYYDATLQRVYPYFTAVIDVQKGVVERITWDDACIFCGGLPGECVETTYDFNGNIQNASGARQPTRSCSLSIDQCNSPEIDPSQAHPCDLMLYVVWTGTDANGQALQSHAYRFSEFPAQELADRVTQLLPDFNSGGGGSRRRSLSEMAVIPDSWKDWWSSWAR